MEFHVKGQLLSNGMRCENHFASSQMKKPEDGLEVCNELYNLDGAALLIVTIGRQRTDIYRRVIVTLINIFEDTEERALKHPTIDPFCLNTVRRRWEEKKVQQNKRHHQLWDSMCTSKMTYTFVQNKNYT